MIRTREEILEALFNLVTNSSPAYVTRSRKLRLWADVALEDRPAIFMFERAGDDYAPVRRIGLPPLTTINVEFFIYTNAKQADVPAALLNPLLDALDQILLPDNKMTGKQTLGGLVDHVWIEGHVIKEPGDLDGDGLAVVPVKIIGP